MLEKLFSNGQKVSPVANPFSKNHLDGVTIRVWLLRGEWQFYSRIEFINGATKGEHRIEGISMNDVIQQTDAFVKALE